MTQYAETVPLSQPYYGASIGVAFTRFWRKYATFSGRASRSEYWWWALVEAIVVGLSYALILPGTTTDPTTGLSTPGPTGGIGAAVLVIWFLATIVPTLALFWRRMHDANFSGAFYFLGLIPFIGGIITLVLTLLPSNPAGARFDSYR